MGSVIITQWNDAFPRKEILHNIEGVGGAGAAVLRMGGMGCCTACKMPEVSMVGAMSAGAQGWVEVGAGPEGGKFVALGGQLCCYAGMPLVAREREAVADSQKLLPVLQRFSCLPVNLLYDIEVDPSELHDMAATRPDVVQTMLERLAWYNESNVDCCICTGSEPTGEMRMAQEMVTGHLFAIKGRTRSASCA